MANDIFQICTFPGVVAVESAQYVCLHGITPGRFVITTLPQDDPPDEYGNLVFSDGRRSVTVRGCKVDRITPQQSSSTGTTYIIEGQDERWQWAGLGGISGHYNQKDGHGKLVPWTIRSPQELAAICFAALAIRRGVVQFPPGLSSAAGRDLNRYLLLGENFPVTGTNPEILWEHTPPAQALAQLADLFGCRVIYQPNAARVLVVPPGKGVPFPSFAYEAIGGTVDSPPRPKFVGVYGSPVKIQARFLLQAVGREWDGTYLPINDLSYAPKTGENKVQISRVRYTGSTVESLSVYLQFTDPKTGQQVAQRANSTTGGLTLAQRYNEINAQFQRNPAIVNNIGIVIAGNNMTFTGRSPFGFDLSCYTITGAPSYVAELTQQFLVPQKASWEYTVPGVFGNVRPTDRLSFVQAQALAQESVYKCYRIVNRDPHDTNDLTKPGRPLRLPWYGDIKRRQQILLQDTMVEFVQPQPRLAGGINKNNLAGKANPNVVGQGILPDFYNGYARERPAVCYGSVWKNLPGSSVQWQWKKDNGAVVNNTDPEQRLFVDFSVNQLEQMIVFGSPVFFYIGGGGGAAYCREPVLTLETGCYVLHPETSTPIRWEELLPLAGGIAPVEWNYREEIQVGVIGAYGPNNAAAGFAFSELPFAKAQANHYLRVAAYKYQITGGETRQYIGIIPHDPDGYCQQAMWSVGAGATTVLAGNTEQFPGSAPYPARRRVENLPADAAAAAVNLTERERLPVPKEVK